MTRIFKHPGIIRTEPLEPRRHLAANAYLEQDLASNGGVPAAHTDTHLVNGWGLVVHAHGFQLSDADAGFSTGYDASGVSVGPSVRVPGPGTEKGAPTGIVRNDDATKFLVANGASQLGSNFIYVTENGTIDAWSTANKNRKVVVAADRSADGSVFKGVALASFKHNPFLYVANFSKGRVDVFNSNFARTHVSGTFADPNLPKGFAPFNVQEIGGQLFVAFAKHLPGESDEVAGAGIGLVDIFGTDGKLVKRFASGGKLNAPWGLTKAPADFAAFSNDILVGNFGDGKISAFDPTTGKFQGQLADKNGTTLVIDGLWGIAFGNGKGGTRTNGLYFAAGPNDESDGLYGRLLVDTSVPASTPASDPPVVNPYMIGMSRSGTTDHKDLTEALMDSMA